MLLVASIAVAVALVWIGSAAQSWRALWRRVAIASLLTVLAPAIVILAIGPRGLGADEVFVRALAGALQTVVLMAGGYRIFGTRSA